MENIGLVLITIALVGLVVYSLWTSRKREGLDEPYDERTCLTLAQQNEEGMKDLEAKIKDILTMQGDVTNAKSQTEANTKQLVQLVKMNSEVPK